MDIPLVSVLIPCFNAETTIGETLDSVLAQTWPKHRDDRGGRRVDGWERSDHRALRRKGKSLASGGDNDIILDLLEAGYSVGYFPELKAEHIMPAFRLTKEYQARLAYGVMRSWVGTLAANNIIPWTPIHPTMAWLRKAKYFVTASAWRGPARFARRREFCGQADGRADLWRRERN